MGARVLFVQNWRSLRSIAKAACTAQIDVPMTDGPDAAQGVERVARRDAVAFWIDGALQTWGLPGHHAVADERERTGGGDQILSVPPALAGQRLGADLSLQGVHESCALGHLIDRAAQVRQREVITQVYGGDRSKSSHAARIGSSGIARPVTRAI